MTSRWLSHTISATKALVQAGSLGRVSVPSVERFPDRVDSSGCAMGAFLMETRKAKTPLHFPHLDGLRFIAFMMVFVCHGVGYNQSYQIFAQSSRFAYFRDHFLDIAGMGVELFFVLSGFLITYLLLKEQHETGRVKIRWFYVRRILRIWPIYFLTVLLGFLVIPHLKGVPLALTFTFENFKFYLLFLVNFALIKGLLATPVLTVLWSVSIEEQFYLVWPWLVKYVHSRALPVVLLGIILFSLGFKYVHAENYAIFHYHTLSAMSYLATGSLAAYLAHNSALFVGLLRNLSKAWIVGLYALGLGLYLVHSYGSALGAFQRLFQTLISLALGLFYAFVILEQNYSSQSWYKMGRFELATRLGKYTYALYSLHLYPIFLTVYAFQLMHWHHDASVNGVVFILEFCVALLAALYVCRLSYRYFEKYFLDLKKHFAAVL